MSYPELPLSSRSNLFSSFQPVPSHDWGFTGIIQQILRFFVNSRQISSSLPRTCISRRSSGRVDSPCFAKGLGRSSQSLRLHHSFYRFKTWIFVFVSPDKSRTWKIRFHLFEARSQIRTPESQKTLSPITSRDVKTRSCLPFAEIDINKSCERTSLEFHYTWKPFSTVEQRSIKSSTMSVSPLHHSITLQERLILWIKIIRKSLSRCPTAKI